MNKTGLDLYGVKGIAVWLAGILTAHITPGSWWGFAPSGVIVLIVVIRTALEDRTLRKELPGYKEYMESTRYRLLPAIW